MITSKITDQKITTEELTNDVISLSSGAIVVFGGNVRNYDKGRGVRALSYEIHPTTAQKLNSIATEVMDIHDVEAISIAHRFGSIPMGESAFVVAVAAAHRAPAFACCEELVERVKTELPIWKFQEFEDGTSEWVNSA